MVILSDFILYKNLFVNIKKIYFEFNIKFKKSNNDSIQSENKK